MPELWASRHVDYCTDTGHPHPVEVYIRMNGSRYHPPAAEYMAFIQDGFTKLGAEDAQAEVQRCCEEAREWAAQPVPDWPA
jgi:hypothetical protein